MKVATTKPTATRALAPRSSLSVQKLNRSELRVLALLGEGQPNKIIAWELNLAETTIKMYISNLMKYFGCINRTQVALLSFCVSRNLQDEALKLNNSFRNARQHNKRPLEPSIDLDSDASNAIRLEFTEFSRGSQSDDLAQAGGVECHSGPVHRSSARAERYQR